MNTPLADTLAAIAALEAAGQGAAALDLLRQRLQQPLDLPPGQGAALADALARHGLWDNLAALIDALAPHPQHAADHLWARLRWAIERNRPAEVSALLAELERRLAAEEQVLPAWKQLRLRAALLLNASAEALAADAALPPALRLRYLYRHGQAAAGDALLAHALPQTPPGELHWLAGTRAAQERQHEQAETHWATALAALPRHAGILFDRGRHRLAHDATPERGEADLLAALAIKPWAGAIAISLAGSHVRRGEYEAALKVLDRSLQAEEDQPEVLAAVLDALRLRGDREPALRLGREALARYPDDGGIWLGYGACLQHFGALRGEVIHAYRQATRCARADLDRAGALSNLAKLLFDEGDIEEAILRWEEALAITPLMLPIRINLAQARLKRGDLERARREFDALRQTHPDNAAAWRGIADCDLQEGDPAAGMAAAREALRLAPQEAQSYLIHAGLQTALGQQDAALRTLESGLRRIGENPIVLHKAIWAVQMKRHRYEDALQRAAHAAMAHPKKYEYRALVVDALVAQNRFAEAQTVLEEARALDGERAGVALTRFHLARMNLPAALETAADLACAHPESMQAQGLHAEVLFRLDRFDEAQAVLDHALKQDPLRLSLHRQKIGQYMAQEQYPAALAAAEAMLARERKPPQFKIAIKALQRARKKAAALELAEAFYREYPGDMAAARHLSRAAHACRAPERVRVVLAAARQAEPDNLEVHSAWMQFLIEQEDYLQAAAAARALLDKPGQPPAAALLACSILLEADAAAEALERLLPVLARHDANRALWRLRYRLERRLERDADALETIAAYGTRFPDDDGAYGWAIDEYLRYAKFDAARATATRWKKRRPEDWSPQFAELRIAEKRKQFGEMADIGARLLKRWPGEPAVLAQLAQAASEAFQLKKAIAFARQAVEMRPDSVTYLSGLAALHAKAGDFSEFAELIGQICKLMGDGRYAYYENLFFNLNCDPHLSAEDLYRYYRDWADKAVTPDLPPPRPFANTPDPRRKLRIGYVSPDFRGHAVAYFSEPLLIGHDREQFELIAFAHLEPGAADATTERFKTYFDAWHETRNLSGMELYRRIREERIDILIDLAGHTSNNALSIFARRAAPVQISWAFGAGQTTGLPQVDYLFSDQHSTPPEFDRFCAETVWRIDWPCLGYRPPENTPDVAPPPCVARGAVRFGSFTRPIRLNHDVFRVWAQILNRLPGATLQLDHVPYAEPEIQAMVRERFAASGGKPEQIVFAATRPHWDAMREIDILLDTFPTNSGTTVTETLWMGVPVVTLESRPIMGRIGATQLRALGLDRLVARSEADYVKIAVTLAQDTAMLIEMRSAQRQRFLASPIMDYAGYGQAAAAAYRAVWQVWCGKQAQP